MSSIFNDMIKEAGIANASTGMPHLNKMITQSEQVKPLKNVLLFSEGDPFQAYVRVNATQYDKKTRRLICAADIVASAFVPISMLEMTVNADGQELGKILSPAANLREIPLCCVCENVPENISRQNVTLNIKYNGYMIMTTYIMKKEITERLHITETDSPIEEITVGDPAYKTGCNRTDPIHVSFNRRSQLSYVVDYDYTSHKDPDSSPTQRVFLDISGKVQLKSGYTYIKDSFQTAAIQLWKNWKPVPYRNNSQPVLEVMDNDRGIHWTYNKDWKNTFDKSIEGTQYEGRFIMTASIKCKTPKGDVEDVMFTICSYSDTLLKSEGSLKEIPRIWFYWGCLAEDTEVLMEGGSLKAIKEIKIGERVSNGNGGSSEVVNIYTGMEQTLIHIKTEGGHSLNATENHPVYTKSGRKQLKTVLGADELLMQDGTFEKIEEAYPYVYDKKVYNLELAEGHQMVCDGIVVGDFTAQNEIVSELENNLAPIEIVKEIEELKRLLQN